jgi:phage shock protein C
MEVISSTSGGAEQFPGKSVEIERRTVMEKRLYRSQVRKMLGGVCAGLGDYFEIDVTLIRLVFVAISLVTAIIPMVIFYLIAWIIIPAEEPKKTG